MLYVDILLWVIFACIDLFLVWKVLQSPWEAAAYEAKMEEIRFWQHHFKERVSGSWIFHDGSGF